jgi:hypothetical protein
MGAYSTVPSVMGLVMVISILHQSIEVHWQNNCQE